MKVERARAGSRWLRALLALALAAGAAACERADHIEIDPRMPRLMHKGETVRLHGKMMDRTRHIFATERARWSSRDPFIAAVDENGEVTALASGHTVLTARWEELSADVPVEVDLVESIRATPEAVSVAVDRDPVKLSVVVLGADGHARADRDVRLMSADPSIARVSGDGQVFGVAPGSTVIHARSDDKEAAIQVTVIAKQAVTERASLERGRHVAARPGVRP